MSMLPPQGPLPQDLRDLVIRLDQKCEDGFTNLNRLLDAVVKRQDSHDVELSELKTDVAAIKADRAPKVVQFEQALIRIDNLEGERDRASGYFKGMIGAFMALVALCGFLGWKITTLPDAQVPTHQTQ